jgi:hypothetical protein
MARRRIDYKFYLGHRVEYRPPQGTDISGGAHFVIAKLPARGREFEYRISNVNDEQERAARDNELRA